MRLRLKVGCGHTSIDSPSEVLPSETRNMEARHVSWFSLRTPISLRPLIRDLGGLGAPRKVNLEPQQAFFFLVKRLCPPKSGPTAKYVFLRFVFNILSIKCGFYTAKYGQIRQMTEKTTLRAKNRRNDRKKVAVRGSRKGI